MVITEQLDKWADEGQNLQAPRPTKIVHKRRKKLKKVPKKQSDNPFLKDINPYEEQEALQEASSYESYDEEVEVDFEDKQEASELLAQFDDSKAAQAKERYRMLIRIGIEFCVTIQDCYFLFYDLFLLFQEEQLEDIFLDELKPFIMAGRF